MSLTLNTYLNRRRRYAPCTVRTPAPADAVRSPAAKAAGLHQDREVSAEEEAAMNEIHGPMAESDR